MISIRSFTKLAQRQMSKKGSSSASKVKSRTQEDGSEPSGAPIPISIAKNGDHLISIQVRPGAKFNCITEVSPEAVSLQISAPPVDGEANMAIVKFFSELLKLKKTEVDLRGSKSRQKTIVITSKNVTLSSLMETLKSNIGEKF